MGNIVLAQGGIPIQQGIYEQSKTKKAELGRLLPFLDGRCFRYCQAATASITKGHMCSAAALNDSTDLVIQTSMTIAISGAVVGAKVIKVLLTADVAANLFDDGLLVVETGTGEGQCHRIRTNKAGGTPLADACEITLYDPLLEALDHTSVISLTVNKYKDVVVTPTTEKSTPIGVPLITITSDYFFWAQTKGYAPLYVGTADTAPAGDVVAISDDENGGCDVAATVSEKSWGVAIQPAAADTYATVDIQLE